MCYIVEGLVSKKGRKEGFFVKRTREVGGLLIE